VSTTASNIEIAVGARRKASLFTKAFLFISILFVFPITLRAALFLREDPVAGLIGSADMSSTGYLPSAVRHPAARLMVMSAPLSGARGQFFTHTWIVLKHENAASWERYEVLGYASRDSNGELNGAWFGSTPSLNRYVPDGRWFGRKPSVLADVEGIAAETMIPKVKLAIDKYEATLGHYRFWPGPNSNTFVASVLRSVPELAATLPPTAVGRDFKPGIYVGLTDSQTGIEASIWGVLGLKIGWVEGLEINFLTFVAGLDVRKPALKVPAFGTIKLGSSDGTIDDHSLAATN
jgi:Protein of unknown function (DUF3750)